MLGSARDPILQELISDVEKECDCSYPVTLFLNGQALSGILVSRHDYADFFGRSVKEEWSFVDQSAAKEKSDKLKWRIEKAKHDPTKYLHLVNVQVVGVPVEKGRGFALRAKLSDVSGFMFGTYSG